jgi:hypothetical protein
MRNDVSLSGAVLADAPPLWDSLAPALAGGFPPTGASSFNVELLGQGPYADVAWPEQSMVSWADLS